MLLSDLKKLYVGPTEVLQVRAGPTLIWPAEDPFALAPAYDTPTITSAAVGASAIPTIAGSAGWFREKRVGVVENTPGGAQTSTAALDTSGSTRFSYPSVYSAAGHAANAGNYILTDYKPGGSTSNARWPFGLKFVTSSPTVELRLRAPVANPSIGQIKVNGKYLQDHNWFATAAAGAGLGVKLTFPDARERTIEFISLMASEGDFGGVAVASGYTAAKPSAPVTRRIAFLTDSYGNGAGTYPTGASNSETFIWRMATRMKADEVIQAGIGATGFTAIVTGQPTSNFAGRVAAVMAMNPHVVVIAGGRNDSEPGLQAAVESLLDSIGTGVERYVLRTSADTSTAVNTAIAAGAASRGVKYLDVPLDALPKIDGIHLTFEAHKTFGDAAFAAI